MPRVFVSRHRLMNEPPRQQQHIPRSHLDHHGRHTEPPRVQIPTTVVHRLTLLPDTPRFRPIHLQHSHMHIVPMRCQTLRLGRRQVRIRSHQRPHLGLHRRHHSPQVVCKTLRLMQLDCPTQLHRRLDRRIWQREERFSRIVYEPSADRVHSKLELPAAEHALHGIDVEQRGEQGAVESGGRNMPSGREKDRKGLRWWYTRTDE